MNVPSRQTTPGVKQTYLLSGKNGSAVGMRSIRVCKNQTQQAAGRSKKTHKRSYTSKNREKFNSGAEAQRQHGNGPLGRVSSRDKGAGWRGTIIQGGKSETRRNKTGGKLKEASHVNTVLHTAQAITVGWMFPQKDAVQHLVTSPHTRIPAKQVRTGTGFPWGSNQAVASVVHHHAIGQHTHRCCYLINLDANNNLTVLGKFG